MRKLPSSISSCSNTKLQRPTDLLTTLIYSCVYLGVIVASFIRSTNIFKHRLWARHQIDLENKDNGMDPVIEELIVQWKEWQAKGWLQSETRVKV